MIFGDHEKTCPSEGPKHLKIMAGLPGGYPVLSQNLDSDASSAWRIGKQSDQIEIHNFSVELSQYRTIPA